jgi:hypothetical protein
MNICTYGNAYLMCTVFVCLSLICHFISISGWCASHPIWPLYCMSYDDFTAWINVIYINGLEVGRTVGSKFYERIRQWRMSRNGRRSGRGCKLSKLSSKKGQFGFKEYLLVTMDIYDRGQSCQTQCWK